jgi:hypothetical protein
MTAELTTVWRARCIPAPSEGVRETLLWNRCEVLKPRLGLPLYRSHDIDTGWVNSRLMTTLATASASFSIRQWI